MKKKNRHRVKRELAEITLNPNAHTSKLFSLALGWGLRGRTHIDFSSQIKALQRSHQVILESPGDRINVTEGKDQAAVSRLCRIKLHN